MVLPTDVLLKTTGYEGVLDPSVTPTRFRLGLRKFSIFWARPIVFVRFPSVTRSNGQLQTPFIRHSQRHRRPHPCPHRRTAAHRHRITPTQKKEARRL